MSNLQDDELAWESEKDSNDDFVTNMVIDAMSGKKTGLTFLMLKSV